MFGWRLYVELDYCAPGIWFSADIVPFSWEAIKRLWRETWDKEIPLCDFVFFVSKKKPEDYKVLLAHLMPVETV